MNPAMNRGGVAEVRQTPRPLHPDSEVLHADAVRRRDSSLVPPFH